MAYRIERAESAETVGVSSKIIQNMIDEMTEKNIDIHSIMVLRHGKVACEAWKAPLTPDDVHMAYSISKSFLSVAYGFAFAEGLLREETRFLDIFPEYSLKADKFLKKLTLIELLGMRSGKRTTRGGKDWLKSFVNAKWDFVPGEDWRYVSENYYAASAALVRLTGMSVTEYLKPRLYDPLGIDTPFWETCPDGIEAGGWGLFLKTEDIAKFILCCHNDGKLNKKQIIPSDWLKKATSYISDTSSSQNESDCRAGYGYGFWQCAGMKNTFRCEGMYSQYAISFGDYDACLVITSGCAHLQKTLDAVWQYMKNAFTTESDEKGINISIPESKPFPPSLHNKTSIHINEKVYKIKKNTLLTCVVSLQVPFLCLQHFSQRIKVGI